MTLPVGSITSALAVTSALPCCVHGAKRQQPKQSINAVLHLIKKLPFCAMVDLFPKLSFCAMSHLFQTTLLNTTKS
jgi:hypothetical protein